MISPCMKTLIECRASYPHEHAALAGANNIFWRQKKVYGRRHAHLDVETWRIHAMRKADNRWVSTIMPGHNHIAFFACRLGVQQISNAQHVRLNRFVSKKNREPSHPIDNDAHN